LTLAEPGRTVGAGIPKANPAGPVGLTID